MSFTTVPMVCGLYPSFKRGVPNQQPPDTYIQQFIDDVSSVLVSILERRFSEAVSGIAPPTINAWLASLGLPNASWYPQQSIAVGTVVLDANSPLGAQGCTGAGITGSELPSFNPILGKPTTDGSVTWVNIGQSRQLQVLERGNRYGAASQLGAVMASFGVQSAAKLADEYTNADWKPFCNELNAEDKNGKPKAYGMFDVLFDPLANVQTPRPVLMGVAGADQPFGVGPCQEGIGGYFGLYGVDYGRRGFNGNGGCGQ